MDSQPESIRSVSWRDLCPWLLILKAIPVSTGLGIIILATVGVTLVPLGWWLSALIFVNDGMLESDYHFAEDVASQKYPFTAVFDSGSHDQVDMGLITSRITGPALVYQHITEPFYHLFHDIEGLRKFGYYLFGCIWNILVWGFFGVSICRIAMLRLCRGERIGIDEAFSYGLAHWPSTLGALTIPLIAVGLICLPLFLVGLMMTFDLGVIIVGVLWVLVLLCTLVVAILLAGLAFGWPLIVASSSAEGQGAFDSLTRCYAYAFQRPLHYLFYALIALLVGGLIWVIAARFTEGIVNLSYWTTSWGANVADGNRVDQIKHPKLLNELSQDQGTETDATLDRSPIQPPGQKQESTNSTGDPNSAEEESDSNSPSRTLIWGHQVISFWNGLLRTVAAGFLHGLFWCLFSAIYLLLRKDVDDSELDEVFLDDERRTFELPPLKNDSDDIPQMVPGQQEKTDDAGSSNPSDSTPIDSVEPDQT